MKGLSTLESELISEHYGINLTTVSIFKRLEKGGEVFYCSSYSRVKRRNSYTVSYMSGEVYYSNQRLHNIYYFAGTEVVYGQIQFFTIFKNKPAVVIRKLLKLPVFECFAPCKTVIPVTLEPELKIVTVSNIKQKCIVVRVSADNCYLVQFPCALRID